jgi:hypothetical protein
MRSTAEQPRDPALPCHPLLQCLRIGRDLQSLHRPPRPLPLGSLAIRHGCHTEPLKCLSPFQLDGALYLLFSYTSNNTKPNKLEEGISWSLHQLWHCVSHDRADDTPLPAVCFELRQHTSTTQH